MYNDNKYTIESDNIDYSFLIKKLEILQKEYDLLKLENKILNNKLYSICNMVYKNYNQ